jgi:hypothetical protein
MTKSFLAPAAICLILAGTATAMAQTAASATDSSATSEQPLRAGGAAGYPPNVFERLWADLGFTKKSDGSRTAATTSETQTADAR